MLFIVKKPRQQINEIIMWLGENLGEDWKITKTPFDIRYSAHGFILAPSSGKKIYDIVCHLREINHPALNSNVETIATFKIQNDKALLFKLKFC